MSDRSAQQREPALWRNISFQLMWTSTAASGFGDRMMMLAALALLGGLMTGVDATATQASTQFWFFLPYLVFAVVGGWLADHLPRKWLLLSCDEARGLILLFAAMMVGQVTGSAMIDGEAVWFTVGDIAIYQTWRVYATLFAIGIFAATFNPTRNAIIPQIIPTRNLTAANAVILVINVVASQIGLVLGQRIISQDDASTVRTGLLLGAGFYLVSGTFFAFLKPIETPAAAPPSAAPRSFFGAGKYVRAHRRVMVLIFLNILIWPAAAVVTSAIFGLGKMHYGLTGDPLLQHFAYLSVTLGVGMLFGGGVVSLVGTRREAPLIYFTAIMAAGVGIVMLAAVPVMVAAYISCFLIGVGGNVAIVSILTLLQSITPNHVRGRVMGFNTLLNTAISVATYYAIWRLPQADKNIAQVMFILGPGLMLVGVYGLVRHLRRGGPGDVNATILWRLNRLFVLVWHRLKWQGRQHIPATGAVLLVSNHTTGLDPLLIQGAAPRQVRWLMVDKYQLRVLWFLWRSVKPITLRRGDKPTAQIRAVVDALKGGSAAGVFPEGGLQRDQRELQPFQPGVILIAQRSGAPVVPVWIEGTPRSKNILWHFLKPSRSTVRFGKPYVIEPNVDRDEALQTLRAKMTALSDN